MLVGCNQLVKMSEDRWPVKVYKWDLSLKQNGWANDVQAILNYSDQLHDNPKQWRVFDFDVIEGRLRYINRNRLWQEAHQKPKLRAFVVVHDHTIERPVIELKLNRAQRSMIIRLKAGVLPMALETGQFKNVPIELRTRKVCMAGVTEDEFYFICECDMLERERERT